MQEIATKYGLTISKVHTHIGAGTDPVKWKEIAVVTLGLAKLFPTATVVSLGGGFKVKRMDDEGESVVFLCLFCFFLMLVVSADLEDIGKHVTRLLQDFEQSTGRKLLLEIEPGTFLTAGCGVLAAKVIDVTDTGKDGYNFIRLDTGMNDILRWGVFFSLSLSVFSEFSPGPLSMELCTQFLC